MSSDETKTVLVVDDDPDIRASVTALLEANDFATMSASNGEEGLARARESAPDIVLLDLLMPGGSGMKFLNASKTDPVLKKVPVVIVSGARKVTGVDMKYYMEKSSLREKKKMLLGEDVDIDAQGFIEKPFDPLELIDMVKKLTGSTT